MNIKIVEVTQAKHGKILVSYEFDFGSKGVTEFASNVPEEDIIEFLRQRYLNEKQARERLKSLKKLEGLTVKVR